MANLILDQPRIWGQVLAESLRRGFRLFSPRRMWNSVRRDAASELLWAPQDLRTADPVLAEEFGLGKFTFAGVIVNASATGPFDVPTENIAWLRELHSFGWLRHLSGAKNATAASQAQNLVSDWISKEGDHPPIAWDNEVVARRLISLLSHSVMLVENADYEIYRKLLKSIASHIHHLKTNVASAPDGVPRLTCRIALAYAGLCVGSNRHNADTDFNALGKSLSHQIYKDGGHISRNPAVLPEILADLLPLRRAFEKAGKTPPKEMIAATDRMMPALRFFRHRDGSLARFNGSGTTVQDLLAVLRRYDDAMGEPTREAIHSGYQRVAAGATVLIMDTGNPPPGEHSAGAHAGTLSFEMSALNHSFIVNCGAPILPGTTASVAARSTAAHSTATLNNTSSCRFHEGGLIGDFLGNRIIGGPNKTAVQRNVLDSADQVAARHDGYLQQFGVWHERVLQLSPDGNTLIGRDRFFANGGKPPIHLARDDCAIRFHLHPQVQASVEESGAIRLQIVDNQSWEFTCSAGEVRLEESIFFASARGAERSSQIVIDLKLSDLSESQWQFVQTIGTRA